MWDVCSDQEAVDLVREVQDPIAASKQLVDHALNHFSTDNLSCMVVRLDRDALLQSQNSKDMSVEGGGGPSKVSEVEKIVMETKQKIADGTAEAVGVSASNSGRGHQPISLDEPSFIPTSLDESVAEEPGVMGTEASSEVDPSSSNDTKGEHKP